MTENVPTGILDDTRITYGITVTDGPTLPVPYSNVPGRMFRVTSLRIDIHKRTNGERRVYVTQFGIVLKKDGTDSMNHTDSRVPGPGKGQSWADHWFHDLATSLGIDLTETTRR